jgi:ATP-dependent Clp protease adaptor protein ClpS
MMQVHLQGRGVAGVYPWEIAETKVDTVTTMARAAGFPLRATIEEA